MRERDNKLEANGTAGNAQGAVRAHALSSYLVRLCLVIVVPVVILAGALAWSYARSEQAHLQRSGLEAARQVAHDLESLLAGLTSSVEVLARARSLLAGDVAGFDARALAEQAKLGAIALFDPAGRLLIDTRLPAGTPLPPDVGFTPTEALLRADGALVSDLTFDGPAQAPSITVDVAVRRGSDIIGFLRVAVPASRIRDVVAQDFPSDGWTATVADRHGTIIARTREHDQLVGKPVSADDWRAATAASEGLIPGASRNARDEPVLAAFSHTRIAGWTVVASVATGEAEIPLRRSLAGFALFAVTLVGLSAGLAVWLARRIAQPIEALLSQAARLGRGEAVQTPASGIREIDRVGAALAQAAAQRTATETQLRDSEARFRALFETAPVALAVVDPDTLAFVAFNSRACDSLGYSRQEFASLRLSAIDAAASESSLWTGLAAADVTVPQAWESQHRTRSGSVRRVLMKVMPVILDGRGLACMAWVDITERHAQEARQAAILDALPAQIALLDATGRIAAVNAAWHGIGGYDGPNAASTGVGADYLAATIPAAGAGDATAVDVLEGLRGILAGQRRRLELVYPCNDPNGSARSFQLIAVPDCSEGSEAAGGAVVMHLDITERVATEQALRASEARLRLAIEAAELGTWDEDITAGQAVWNAASYRILGLEPFKTPTNRALWRARVHPDDRELVDAAFEAAVADDTLYHCEYRIIRPDGNVRWIRPLGRVLRDKAGVPVRFLGVINDITDLKQASEGQARLLQLVEHSNEFIATADLDGRLTYVNRRGRHMIGLDQDAAARTFHFADCLGHSSEALFQSVVIPTVRDKGLWEGEMQFVSQHSGAVLDVWHSAIALIDRGGALTGFGMVARDITAARRDERKLADSEARQRLFIERAPAAIAMVDTEMRYLAVSRRYLTDYGLDGAWATPEAILGRSHYDIFPNFPARWRDIHRRVLTDGETLSAEEDLLERADGHIDRVQWEMVPWRHADNVIGGALLFSEVVTAKKAAEAALRSSEAQLRSILETVPDAMVLIDEQGLILSFSATAERLFGWTAQDVAGHNVSMLMASPDRERHDQYLAHYRAGGERRIIGIGRTVTGRRKDGSPFPMDLSVGEVHADGRRMFTGFIRDLTERVATQARLHDLQEDLAHLSRIGTAGVMVSALAHELNQPLTATTSAVRAARRMLAADEIGMVPAAVKEALDLAAEQALRAGHIVRWLREFIGRGGEVDKRLQNLSALVDEASTLALLGAREAGILVTVRIPPELPLVLGDRVQIQQVLVNLVGNAVQALAHPPEQARAGATITVTADVREVSGAEMVEVAVADNGPGLSPEVAEHLFEPFVTTKRSGMGVGLSICRSIVEAHGGRIWSDANPDGGTVFRFTLQAWRPPPPIQQGGSP